MNLKAFLRTLPLAYMLLLTVMLGGVLGYSPVFAAPLVPNMQEIISNSEALQQATVEVKVGLGEHNPKWVLSHTALQVLPAKLNEMMVLGGDASKIDPLLMKAKNPEPKYAGLVLNLMRYDGKRYAPITVFNGKVTLKNGTVLVDDVGRLFEYWLFGTARIKRDLLLASQIMPVLTFDQCRVLGNPIIDTLPRQCLLPDQNILLDSGEKLNKASLTVTNFDQCLEKGQALIYTFPRRCLVAGGKVFTEPPRVYDAVSPLLTHKPQFMLSKEINQDELNGTTPTPEQTDVAPLFNESGRLEPLDESSTLPPPPVE